MKLTRRMTRLICELEYLIGSECYNPNSYDYWEEGQYFRYPLHITGMKKGEREKYEYKVRGNAAEIFRTITPEAIDDMNYQFGSNQLFIGRGLISVLEALEKRYDLDFFELEMQRVGKKTKEAPQD